MKKVSMASGLSTVSYRLRKKAAYGFHGGGPYLQLSYPLKTVRLHPAWDKAFQVLKSGGYHDLGEIAAIMHPVDADDIELFLNDLVRGGFLRQRGTRRLLEFPLVSVIIPVRNRPTEIKSCLESLARLDYPENRLEILVVDDASSDNTLEIINTFPVRVIPLSSHRQASHCRNLAASMASGEILAFIDSDCLAEPQWLQELVPSFRDPDIVAVGGFVDGYHDESSLDCYEKVKSSLNLGSWPRRSKKNDPFFYLPSCNLLVRREQFMGISGFKEKLSVGEDVDLCWRLRKQGHEIEYQPKGKIYHKHRNRLDAFCKRRFDYGTSEPMLHREHGEKIKRLYLPPLTVLFWSCMVLSLLASSASIFVSGIVIAWFDAQKKYVMIRKNNIRVNYGLIAVSAARTYLAFFFHICSFVSRYYLFLCLILFPFIPQVSAGIAGMHLLTALTEYYLKKPGINLLAFIGYFSLEQLSYQAGVWWGCFANRCFKPVNPNIVYMKFSGEISGQTYAETFS